MTEKCFVLIDGLNLFIRHYVAHPAISENGEQVGGIVGFLNFLSRFVSQYKPTDVYVVWESGGSIRKRNIFSDYKKKRKPQKLNRYYEDIPDTLENRNEQIQFLIKILDFLPVCQIYVPDCEADDVIGYLCNNKYKNNRKAIVSSDRDYYQLLNDKTLIYSPTWKKIVNFKEVLEKFKIHPENFCLAKSICGDPSDNISGIKGAGFKTIAKRYPSLCENKSLTISDIVDISKDRISNGSQIKLYKNIIDNEDIIRRNWKLTYLDVSSLSFEHVKKIEYSIDNFKSNCDKFKAIRLCLNKGIKTIDLNSLFLSFKNIGGN